MPLHSPLSLAKEKPRGAGRDAHGRAVKVVGLLGVRRGAHDEGLALVEIDALEVDAQGGVARERDRGVAREQVNLAGLQDRPALLHGGRRELHLGGVTEHRGCERAAIIHVDAAPLALVVGEGEAGQAEMHAAFEMAARLDGVERRARRELLGGGGARKCDEAGGEKSVMTHVVPRYGRLRAGFLRAGSRGGGRLSMFDQRRG